MKGDWAIVTIEHADGHTEVWNVPQTRAAFIRQDLMSIDGAPDIEEGAPQ